MTQYASRHGEYVGPTVFSSHRPSPVAGDEELIHYRPSAAVFGDKFLSEEERERIGVRSTTGQSFSTHPPILTKRNDAGQRHYSRYSSDESPGRQSFEGPYGRYQSTESSRRSTNTDNEVKRESLEQPHLDLPRTGSIAENNAHTDINSTAHHYEAHGHDEILAPQNGLDDSVEIYTEEGLPFSPHSDMTDILHGSAQSRETEDDHESRPPSFSFADDELKKLRGEEERLKQEMRDAEENLRAIRQLRAKRESKDSPDSDYTPRRSASQNRTESIDSGPSSRLSSRQSSSRPSDVYFSPADDFGVNSPEGPPPISPRSSLNQPSNGRGGFPKAVLEEFQTTLRRNASETPPVSPEKAEAEFKEKVLRRQHTINKESEAYLQSEREAVSRMRETALAPKEDNFPKHQAPKAPPVMKTAEQEYEERHQRAQEQLARLRAEISPEKFFDETPLYGEKTGLPLPNWKREQIAKKRADRAYKEAEEAIQKELESKGEHVTRVI